VVALGGMFFDVLDRGGKPGDFSCGWRIYLLCARFSFAWGVLLLLAPDKIVAIILKTFDKISNKITGKSDDTV